MAGLGPNSPGTITGINEVCLEYYKRRLSEGWKEIKRNGFNVILLSPDGVYKEMDLRNDVETLRPNAVGDETALSNNGGSNWDRVDDVSPDGFTTYVYIGTTAWARDLYNLPASSGSGTINNITVYAICRAASSFQTDLKIAVKIGGTVYESAEKTVDDLDFVSESNIWTINPNTSSAWTWANIDDLQIGITLRESAQHSGDSTYCTQVYVEIDYTGSGATGTGWQSASGWK